MRPIDADALLRCRRNFGKPYALDSIDENIDDQLIDLRHVLNAPTLDYAPVKHGEWVTNPDGFIPADIHCSECGKKYNFFIKPNYCPNCGARMNGSV